MSDDVDHVMALRKNQHGEFRDHARITQQLKSVVLDGLLAIDKDLPDIHAEALDMILHKIGRIVAGDHDHKDHWIDICGYSKLVADRIEI
jgi:hypothetical protein